MREFRDDLGRPWQVALTVLAAMRVRDTVTIPRDGQRVPFDLIDLSAIGETMQALRGQYSIVAEALYAICSKQADDRKVSREEFLDGLKGDALDNAAKALEEELIDFFPLRLRKMLGTLAAKMTEATQAALDQAEKQMTETTGEELLALSGTRSGSVPESSASIPESGPTDSSSLLEQPA